MSTHDGGELTHLRSIVEAVDVGVEEMRAMIDGPEKAAAGALVPTGHCVRSTLGAWTSSSSSSTVGKCIREGRHDPKRLLTSSRYPNCSIFSSLVSRTPPMYPPSRRKNVPMQGMAGIYLQAR